MIFYYLILKIYILFSKSFMLQNEVFKNNFDLLWYNIRYIVKGKRYKIVIWIVAVYL